MKTNAPAHSKKAKVEFVLALTAPLHISCTRETFVDPKTLFFSDNKNRAGADAQPGTGTRLETTLLPLAAALTNGNGAETGDDEPKPAQPSPYLTYPTIPANLLRGRLRRLGAELFFEATRNQGEQLSLGAYHGMTCGAVTGQPSGALTLSEADAASTHPFLGLFGGGPRLIESSITVHTAKPITTDTIRAGIVPDSLMEHATSAHTRSLTRAVFFVRKDDALQFSTPDMASLVVEYPKAITDWIAKTGENAAARRAKREGNADAPETKKVALKSFSAFEAVLPGTRFHVQLEINYTRCGAAGLGLFLLSLGRLFERQRLGGWTRNGLGLFSVENAVLRGAGGDVPLLKTTIAGAAPELNVDAPIIGEALDAWTAFADQPLAAAIEKLMKLETKTE